MLVKGAPGCDMPPVHTSVLGQVKLQMMKIFLKEHT